MILIGFFVGIFLATFSVASQTLFLNNFDPQQDLPKGIVAAGLLGLISTLIYNFFEGRISYNLQVLLFLAMITISVTGLVVAYRLNYDIKTVVFVSFAANGPFAALLIIIFWGTFNRLFSLKEAKKIIGNIDSGILIASLLSFFSIPIIVQYLNDSYELYFISMGCIIMVFIILLITAQLYNLNRSSTESGEKIQRYSYPKLVIDKNTRIMALFVIVSMVCVAFVNFSFLNVTSHQFPEETDLAGFLSLFGAAVVIFSFLFQTFITDTIISNYGIKVALMVNPILLGILALGAIFVGAIFGFSATASNFIIFFLMICMCKFFLDLLKDALDGPTFKLYFLPLPAGVRFDVQTKVEGVVNVFAGLVAGSLIILFGRIETFSLLMIVIAIVPIAVLWYFVTFWMHRRYRETLKGTLESNRKAKDTAEEETGGNNYLLTEKASSASNTQALLALNLMGRIEPALFEQSIKNLSSKGSDEINQIISKAVAVSRTEDKLIQPGEIVASETRRLASMALESQEDQDVSYMDPKQLLRLAKSPNPEERLQIAILLRKIISEENSFILVELLRDVHPRVKIAAINTSRVTKLPATWPFLVELLGTITFSHHAFSALVAMGEEILPYLEKAYHRSGQTAEVMLKIARIYERIGGDTAIDLLWDKIDDPDKELINLILNSLKNNKYKVPQARVGKIKNLLELTLGYTLWNLAAIEELSDVPRNSYIRQALNDEVKDNFDRVYLLLGLMYDPKSISLVRKNIESGTTEGVTFALELLDIFVDKEIRRKLFPILDDITVAEKLNQLQDDFPREHFDEIQVLKQLLNRDYNQINQWTKACALYTLYQNENLEITDSMIAHLFNPDALLRETAAWLIRGKDLAAYNRISSRIRREVRTELNDVLAGSSFTSDLTESLSLRFEKILFLKSTELFKNLPGYLIAEVVEAMYYKTFARDQQIFESLDRFAGDLFIVASGKVSVDGPDGYQRELNRGDAIGEITLQGVPAYMVRARAETAGGLLVIGPGRLFDLMAKHDELTKTFIETSDKEIAQSTVLTS